jgi:adenosine deaminase
LHVRDLATLPKAHLHLHLDGAIREQTLSELCRRDGIEPPVLPTEKRYSSFDAFMERAALTVALDAGHGAAARYGIGFGLMVAANLHGGPEAAAATARLAAELAAEGVVSFGLDGDEAAFPPALFAEAFDVAKSARLLSTPHAGELLGPDSVATAVDQLHADRILHGVRAAEDPALVARIARAGVSLDVCPTSNAKLGVC